MRRITVKPSWRTALDLLIAVVACHSVVGGLLLLFFPLHTLRFVGWGYAGPVFWPSQAGLFLLLLGGVYALAIRLPVLTWFLIVSKACALVFLAASAVLLDAPRVVIAMAAGDGAMGFCVALVFWRCLRLEAPGCKGG